MIKFLFLSLFNLFFQLGYSQIVVFDSINKISIPNVSVIFGSNTFTTISDLNGEFKISNEFLKIDSSITFSHISYQTKSVKSQFLKKNDTIFLTPITRKLDDVVVSSNTTKDYLVLKGFYRSYLYNDNMVYGYSDGIVEYFINLNTNLNSNKSLTNKVISNRLYIRKYENNIKKKGFIKIGHTVIPSLLKIIPQSLSHIIELTKNENEPKFINQINGKTTRINYDLLSKKSKIINILGIRVEFLKKNSTEEYTEGKLNPLFIKSLSNNLSVKVTVKNEDYMKSYYEESIQEFLILNSYYISEKSYKKIKTSKSFICPNSNNIEILTEYKNKYNFPLTPSFIENQIGNGLDIK